MRADVDVRVDLIPERDTGLPGPLLGDARDPGPIRKVGRIVVDAETPWWSPSPVTVASAVVRTPTPGHRLERPHRVVDRMIVGVADLTREVLVAGREEHRH